MRRGEGEGLGDLEGLERFWADLCRLSLCVFGAGLITSTVEESASDSNSRTESISVGAAAGR